MASLRKTSLRIIALSLLHLVAASKAPTIDVSKVIELTDANFDPQTSDGQDWLITVFAPWCRHCMDLKPIWEKVAAKLDGRVKVARVDATKERVLAQRFFVKAFPLIVHLHQGELRDYGEGGRSEEQLAHFALEGWGQVKPVPFYMAPNSKFGRVLGIMLGFPSTVRALVDYLRNTLHLSVLSIVMTFLTFPILIGLVFICGLDQYHTRAARRAAQGSSQAQINARPHQA